MLVFIICMIVRRAGLLTLGDYKLLLHHTEIQNMYAFDTAVYNTSEQHAASAI